MANIKEMINIDKFKKTLKYVASTFLVLLVTLCIYTFIVTDVMKKDYVNIFGYTYFVVASGSMSGTIEVDDIIFVRLTKEVNVDDVITFKSKDGDIITHRLIRKDGSNYITKGDVNNVSDDTITKNQIIGKVTKTVSPSFIIKSIAIFIILFIFLALVNFDEIVKKYIVKLDKEKPAKEGPPKEKIETLEAETPDKVEKTNKAEKIEKTEVVKPKKKPVEKLPDKLPDDIFKDPNQKVEEEPTSGLTVTISIKDMERLKRDHERAMERQENVEVLDYAEYLFDEDVPKRKKNKNIREKETIDVAVSILKCKANNSAKSRMNKKWLVRYQYIYKICHLLLLQDTDTLIDEINNPPFEEIYNYDLERVGLTEAIRNRIYDMPIHVFLRLMTYSVLYNDDEMFDGIYKILKYKIMFDKEGYFRVVPKSNTYSTRQIKTLISFMKEISDRFDNKKVFELDKIERMVKIGNY